MNLNVCHNISVKSKNINLMMSREENSTSVGNIVCGPSTSAQKIHPIVAMIFTSGPTLNIWSHTELRKQKTI